MPRMRYTKVDVFYDILVWQLPVPCVLALCFVVSLINQKDFAFIDKYFFSITGANFRDLCHAATWVYRAVAICLLYIGAWLAVAVPILVLDLLCIPFVFACVRFVEEAEMKLR